MRTDRNHRSRQGWLTVAAIVAPALVVLVVGLRYEAPLRELHADFGATLPALSRLAFGVYPWTLLFPVLILPCAWLRGGAETTHAVRRLSSIVLFVALAGYVLWLAVVGVGLGLPLYRLLTLR